MNRGRTTAVTILAMVAIASLTGCGSTTAEGQAMDKAKEAATSYVSALASSDYARVCALEDKRALEAWPNESRESAVHRCQSQRGILYRLGRQFGVEFPEAQKVELSGNTAKVEIAGANHASAVVDLTNEDGNWRVSNEKTGG